MGRLPLNLKAGWPGTARTFAPNSGAGKAHPEVVSFEFSAKSTAPVPAARFSARGLSSRAPRKVRAARDAGVQTDPQACISRETQAERHLSIRHRSVW